MRQAVSGGSQDGADRIVVSTHGSPGVVYFDDTPGGHMHQVPVEKFASDLRTRHIVRENGTAELKGCSIAGSKWDGTEHVRRAAKLSGLNLVVTDHHNAVNVPLHDHVYEFHPDGTVDLDGKRVDLKKIKAADGES